MAPKASDGDVAVRRDKRAVTSTRKEHFGLLTDREKLLAVLEDKGGGSKLRGWRRELDPDGSLDISFQNFCKACATGSLGVEIDAGRLFGVDGDCATLDLEELAPAEGKMVKKCRQWAKAKFGGPMAMFEALDTTDNDQVSLEEFMTGCRLHDFQATDHDFNELFCMIDVDDTGNISEQQCMFLEEDRELRELEIFRSKMGCKHHQQRLLAYVWYDNCRRVKNQRHRSAPRPWLADNFEKLPALVCGKRLDFQRMSHRNAVKARASFLRHLRSVFGNEVRAWRRALDPGRVFAVEQKALSYYCRRADLDIDVPALWAGLDRDNNGSFTMEELDPLRSLALANLREWAVSTFGSCSALWENPTLVAARGKPQRNGSWVSSKKVFAGACSRALKALGCPSCGSADADALLCSALDLYGCGFISQPDFGWLDSWEPPEYLVEAPEPGAWAELREMMLKKFSSPLKAWRALLDTDSNNRVCWGQFVIACRKMKFRGGVGGAWRCLDRDFDGIICLREFDAATADILGSFKCWAEDNFGSVESTFKSFDSDGSGSLTYSELRRACQKLSFQGDVRALFDCLGVQTGGDSSLTLADVAFLDNWVEDEPNVEAAKEARFAIESLRAKQAPQQQERRPSCLDAESPANVPAAELSPVSGQSPSRRQRAGTEATTASMGGSASVPKFEKLHRTYHCSRWAPAARTRMMPRSSSGPLPWLERINRIDREFDGGFSHAGQAF